MSAELYFDAERIAAEPDKTFLSVQGAEMLLFWRDKLEEADYYPFGGPETRDVYAAAGWLIANEHSDADLMSTAVMLTFLP